MLHAGVLLTRVFTSRGQLPVENAAVSVVLHSDSDRHTLLNIQTTDRSGNTLPTTIETPQLQNSQAPDQETPFALCDIWVEHSGYQPLTIQNVQIFPGITSIQDLPLLPVTEAGERSAERVEITPQDL